MQVTPLKGKEEREKTTDVQTPTALEQTQLLREALGDSGQC